MPQPVFDLTDTSPGTYFSKESHHPDAKHFSNGNSFAALEFPSIPSCSSGRRDTLKSSTTQLFYRDATDNPKTYETVQTSGTKLRTSQSPIQRWIQGFKVNSVVFEIVLCVVVPVLVWLAGFVIVGSQNLPGGSVFVIVFLEFGGRILGYIVTWIKLPPMVGMLGLGIAIRNVPYIDFGKSLDPDLVTPIRLIAIAIILTRAGFTLDLDVLINCKWIVARLAIFPAVVEALSTAVLLRYLVGFPWAWSFLTGFVIASVSPAVVVPRIIALKEQGYGEDKGIPTMILASASLENTVAISVFHVMLAVIFGNETLTKSILRAPAEIAGGISIGILWGFFVGMIFPPAERPNDYDTISLKVLVLVGGCISSLLGFSHLGYSGAGALSCLISAVIVSNIWRQRSVNLYDNEVIKWSFVFLWKLMEPLIFGVLGSQIILSELSTSIILYGLICLILGATIRFSTVLLMVSGTGLNLKEKIFVGISWIPKATVQTAIGPMALHLAREAGNKDQVELGLKVLTIAVLVILLTTPLGEIGVIMTGPKLLQQKKPESDQSPEFNGNLA